MLSTKLRHIFWLSLVVPFLLFSQEISKQNGYYGANIVKTFTIGSGGKLILDNSNGDVNLQSWERDNVEIREKLRLDVFTQEEAQEIARRSESGYSYSGNTIRVESDRGGVWMRRDYVVYLPAKFDLDIRSSNGDISGKGLNGFISLRTSNGEITLAGASGEIEIKTSAGDLRLEDINGLLHAATSAGNVSLRNLGDNADVSTSGGNIRLFNAKKNAEVKTSGGEIRVDKVGGNLVARTSGGNIDVSDCAGIAELHTSGGDIDISNMGSSVEAHTSGGDIRGKNIDGPVGGRTSGGDIDLRDVRGGVDASTAAGDVEVEITLKDFKKDHRIHLETASGSIKLTLPPKIPASISAEIRDAGGRWKRYDIYSDFPLSIESEDGGRAIRRKGDINGGGDEIVLETSNGDIYIRKGE